MALPQKFLMALMFVTLPAMASTPRRPVQAETYPATESETASSTTVNVQTTAPAANTAVAPATRLKPVGKLPDSALSYDPVPSDQIDALSRRLQLVDALIRRHARAYDYRTHTVHDLELTLAKLDASIAPKAAPAAAPRAQLVPPTAPATLPIPSESDEVNGGDSSRATD